MLQHERLGKVTVSTFEAKLQSRTLNSTKGTKGERSHAVTSMCSLKERDLNFRLQVRCTYY